MATRVRKNAWTLKPFAAADPWDEVFEWYAKGILDLRRRGIADPTSWRYQAAIHAYDRAGDPFKQTGEALPSTADQTKFWNQCQHASWFFLPWHRMYLGYFEAMITAAIKRLGGPHTTWALPYWNYSDTSNPNARKLPLAFTLPTMPGGAANPLRVEQRVRGNNNAIVATPNQVNVRTCLIDHRFEAPGVGGSAGFGGPQTAFKHSGGFGDPIGKLESTPHGSMHMAVGGFMGSFETAGLDPMFWLHHANIDRLWVVWRKRNPIHVDPTKPQWLTNVKFSFHDATGAVVTRTASEVVDTASPLFDYKYDNVTDPVGGTEAAAPTAARSAAMAGQPEMVGANNAPVVLTGGAETTSVPVSAPRGPAAGREAAALPEVHLNIENVTGLGARGTYAVYVNVPAGERPEDHQELLAGLVPMFGVTEATRGDANRPGDGLTFSLDITEVVRRLQAAGTWTGEVRVTFAPEDMPAERQGAETAPAPVTVGRVSVYYS